MTGLNLKALIREIPDFPQPGVSFKDISTVIGNAKAFHHIIQEIAGHYRAVQPEVVVGIESRGYILGAPVAYELQAGFILVRKPGKLPAATERIEYSLEYGENSLEIHTDAIRPGQKVLIVDDILATGGTVSLRANWYGGWAGRLSVMLSWRNWIRCKAGPNWVMCPLSPGSLR